MTWLGTFIGEEVSRRPPRLSGLKIASLEEQYSGCCNYSNVPFVMLENLHAIKNRVHLGRPLKYDCNNTNVGGKLRQCKSTLLFAPLGMPVHTRTLPLGIAVDVVVVVPGKGKGSSSSIHPGQMDGWRDPLSPSGWNRDDVWPNTALWTPISIRVIP